MPDFKYEDYGSFARQIAKTKTFEEIKKEIRSLDKKREGLSQSHLNAIESTSGMTSQSQRRAHTRNSMTSNYERLQAHKDAIEIYIFYPHKCKDILSIRASFSKAVVEAYIAGGGTEYDAKEYFFENYCC